MTVSCDCCEPAAPLTPLDIQNRPGLSALAYRIGTYASFRQAMLTEIARTPELVQLSTRQSDDYSITIVELWAVVADVLTFYQERYVSEAFLRPARLRESVGRLARLVDYSLRPGAAALVYLAFTVDKDKSLQIPVGLRVQSVPGPQKNSSAPPPQPQMYETLEALNADARWNRLRIYPVPSSTVGPLAQGQSDAILDRTTGPQIGAALAPRDRIIIFDNSVVEEKEIAATRIENDRVVITWTQPIQRTGGWSANASAYKFKRTLQLFGINAPSSYMMAAADPNVAGGISWSFNTLTDYSYPQSPTSNTELELDARYDGLQAGGKLLFADSAGAIKLVTVIAVDQVQATLGGASDTVTRVTLAASDAISTVSDRRTVTIYELVGSAISFWDLRYAAKVSGDTVYLSGWKVSDAKKGNGIEVGRTITRDRFEPGVVVYLNEIEIGRRVLLNDADNQPLLATIKGATITPPSASAGDFCHLALQLALDSSLNLDTASAILFGNVALASQGETVKSEVVGNGDASKKFQTFKLQKKPLTYVPDANPTGVKSTLQLLVNQVRWKQVPELYGQAPNEQVYKTRLADDSTTIIQFGDGTTGAVPPTGRGNIVATYRNGLGLAGRVTAGQLTTLMDRPNGLTGVTNPLPSDGGADPETMENARQNSPLSVRTFGRAVSLRDFEDLVLGSGQAAKAQATWVWDGYDRAIFLTVVGQEGQLFTSDGLKRLGDALDSARDPNHRLRLANYAQVPITLQAALRVDDNFVQKDVLNSVMTAITNALSFDALRLAQPIHLSDMYTVLQGVVGVVSVDINTLLFKQLAGMTNTQFQAYLDARGVTRLSNGDPDPVQGHLRIFPARPDSTMAGSVLPAELAWVQSTTQDILLNASGGLTQ